jgi:hypothetical protein
MSATGADPQSESTRLRRESRIWGLIRRTLPLGRSIGSLLYLISIALIAGWIIAVFFGVSFYFLMPRSAELEPGVSPSSTNLNASSAEAPSQMEATSGVDRLSTPPPPEASQPIGDAAADKDRPAAVVGSQNAATVNPPPVQAEATIAHVVEEPPGQALTVEPVTATAATGEAAPVLAPRSQPSTAPDPRKASLSSRSPSPRKPPERRPSNARKAQSHAPMSAIEDVLQKHSGLLK